MNHVQKLRLVMAYKHVLLPSLFLVCLILVVFKISQYYFVFTVDRCGQRAI
jgi:hypothetical protein